MIGWIILSIVGVYLLGTAGWGLFLWFRRAAFEKLGAAFVEAGIGVVLATTVFVWTVMQSQWGVLAGLVGGVVFFVLLVGWDEFYDEFATGFYACVKREVGVLFTTPIPYFVLFLFVLLSGFFFWAALKQSQALLLRIALMNLAGLGIFLFPLLTMASFAKEKAEGTVEVLMTAPVSDVGVVVAKFLGILSFYVVMLLPTIIYYGILAWIGGRHGRALPDPGPVVTSYIGMMLMGSFFIAMGMFASSLTSSQILAALFSWVLTIFFLIAGSLVVVLGLVGTPTGSALDYLNPIGHHLNSFLTGVVDPKHVLFFLSFVVFFLFLSVRSVESRKWR